jgi:hypothetical protein
MSYAHLAGRLIEIQRSMLGESAIKIARSTEGITVTDGGTVKAVEGDKRAVVGELAQEYTAILGEAAEQRLLAAASEFDDEIVLPAALGGPETRAANNRDPAADGRATVNSADAGGPSDAVSDGGTAAVEAAPEPGPSTTGYTGEGDASAEVQSSDDDGPVSVADPVTVEYTVASSVATLDPGTDPDDIYLMPANDRGWQAPVTVADAFVDAVAEATGLDEAALDAVGEYVDVERLLATLNDESGETVSFGVKGFTVTFHRSGSVAVH